ncbi:MAG: helix-turn-helix transcriptional regulator [Firmicutes bacterium]|nr:helix-turn-helix transcriptional regulator [Bacillota bacterium]
MKKIYYDTKKNVISKQLKLARVKEGLSQSQLAARMQTLGVSIDQQMISRIEANARMVTDYELASFSRALHVPPEELLKDFMEDITNAP